jgi:hypothetical protein
MKLSVFSKDGKAATFFGAQKSHFFGAKIRIFENIRQRNLSHRLSAKGRTSCKTSSIISPFSREKLQ